MFDKVFDSNYIDNLGKKFRQNLCGSKFYRWRIKCCHVEFKIAFYHGEAMMKNTVEERTYGRNKRSMGYVMGYI